MNLTVERWEQTLGKSKYLLFTEERFSPICKSGEVSGWYADYDEGRFAYWFDGDRQYIYWRGKKIELVSTSRIEWESTITGRSFKVISNGKIQLHLKYHTLARRPWRLITDIVFMDDDWGLVYDLPSFIHSRHTEGDLGNQLEQWTAHDNS